jgi:Fe-S oxidoreductase
MSDLRIPTMAEMMAAGETPEVLVWVGCAGAFDDRARKITKAFVRILNAARVKFAVLGTEETCTGDPARRAGNEFLFQMQALQNVAVLNGYGVKRIVTACPHCFNTLKNEYPALGGSYEVMHHTQFINALLKEGEYEAPREVLLKLDAALVELKRSRAHGLCCGAGGAQMFKEAEPGTREVNHERAEEALAASPDVIAAGCPFCNTMLTDGVKKFNQEGQVQVLDVAELIARAGEL